MKKKIEIDPFDKRSIAKAINELDNYYEQLEEKCKKLVLKLAEHGAEVAKATIASLPYSTGDLLNNIYAVYDEKNHCAMLKADSDHAVFVEFGTGLVGEGTYPNSEYLSLAEQFGWQGYLVGGEENQEFLSTTGRWGWITIMNNGKVYFTEGQEAKHFMDDAGKAIQEQFETLVQQVFKE